MKVIHLSGLNGIRAIAALIVVVSHVGQALGSFELPQKKGLEMAGFGVTIFFTLSGFLITYLLLLEKKKYADINIKNFYLRRILRIWPLYYFYLVISLGAIFIYDRHIIDNNIFYFIFMMANVPYFLDIRVAVIVHFWSLGVEEQFYLFWPWVVKKIDKLFNWLLIFIGSMLILKFLCWLYFLRSGNQIPLDAIHITRFHCMALGACGAILFYKKDEKFIKFAKSVIVQLIVLLVFVICLLGKFHIAHLVNDEIISVATVFLIINAAIGSKVFFYLNSNSLDYLGRISYGIYVYHPLVLYLCSKLLITQIKSLQINYQYITIYSLTIIFTILIADLSYKYFESPFLKLKDRFARVKSSSSISKETVTA